ncbi:EamA family transporter RarD [Chungangia koreensis]|uniref:EamA family transporter RarD n=1 Tax=Chungangia koreensis TaxID=752657 RepID=A0ABV8X1J9_9LACT
MNEERKGIIWAASAYLLWGFFPLYWKTISQVSSGEILASRIFWSFITTLLVVMILGKRKELLSDIKGLMKDQRQMLSLILAALLISINWFLYIWAVNTDRIIETSLGYYINPLVSVLIGIVFLKERLAKAQIVAFFIALAGVLIMTFAYGRFPWVAFSLALSFAFYGLIKKTVKLEALRGLTIETLFIVPLAVTYYIFLFAKGDAQFLHTDRLTDLLLMLSGAATAIPLLLFAKGAQRIPLYMIGFLQYIAPTLMLLLAVLVYGENFGNVDILSFSLIWLSLLLFSYSTFKGNRNKVKIN